jgi:hypothetical protein
MVNNQQPTPTNQKPTHPEANTTSTELCNFAIGDMSLSNELQNFDFEDIKRNLIWIFTQRIYFICKQ